MDTLDSLEQEIAVVELKLDDLAELYCMDMYDDADDREYVELMRKKEMLEEHWIMMDEIEQHDYDVDLPDCREMGDYQNI